ncbi:MAG: hypothetical protein H8D78_03310 [Chloroflexi bacterium]|nr:hypothetical protein [Chloroflexota bacterium]
MEHSTRLRNDLVMTLAAFCVLVASVSLLWRNNLLLFFVALAECVTALILWHDRLDVSFFLIIGVLGSLAEAVFVRFGVWHYANPTFLGMPMWFPLAFGTTGLIGARLARAITEMWERASPSSLPEDTGPRR